jgi:hypothetical protein
VMGARKKLSQSLELKLQRLSFFLCPQTPDWAFCEAKARPFNLIRRNPTDLQALTQNALLGGDMGGAASVAVWP